MPAITSDYYLPYARNNTLAWTIILYAVRLACNDCDRVHAISINIINLKIVCNEGSEKKLFAITADQSCSREKITMGIIGITIKY